MATVNVLKVTRISAVAVDTGTIAIGDPCTMRRKDLLKSMPALGEDAVFDGNYGPIVASTGGDGIFPVCWLEDDNGKRIGLAVFFREQDAPPASEGAGS